MAFFALVLAILCLKAGRTSASAAFEQKCSSFDPSSVGITNATVTEHVYVGSGTNLSLPDNDPSCNYNNQVVPANLCRVALQIATSGSSGIVAEVWLPENWNGRLVTTGNGGLGGCIDYSAIAYTANNGFASVGTNNGHNGTSAIQFLNSTEVVVDFAWRAVHTGVEAGKKLTQPFYGESANKSYFLGCSLGGRQAIKATEMFPADFDGVVAGSPAVDFVNLYSWRARFYPATGPVDSPDFITPTVWKTTIHQEVLRQCDLSDGVSDGIIEDPMLCHFDPSTLLCGGTSNSSACLSSSQVEIVRNVFETYTWENGTLLYPRMNPGGEIMSADGLYNGQPWAVSQNWFRYAVYNNPNWDPAAYTLTDAHFAADANPGTIRTWPSSLSAFQDRGGRVIMFHGGQDNQITSFNSPRFYDHLAEGMGYTTDQMDEFIRFFRISGMFHCNSGPGAWVIGQQGGSAAQGAFDRESNVLAAVVDWVEKGMAPETMTGTKFVNDSAALGISFQRRHCRWPLRNIYLGGDPKDPQSWECQKMDGDQPGGRY
ncbi:hypothetical protein KVR01_004593 [Diaporthe batatas]|uniref:uncharacterized protein n=1 Tax=Diaporthe batatas TaxID=748121 RepID=UPI001D04A9C8|nr:uncharacterized protein KVR01_004593 [Diaporthe batatas]KAG8166041.1 hypothetical protein KVR01_004593 [Diaporthe batatas]